MGTDHFVYRLVDKTSASGPGQGVFYIGMGSGIRYYQHIREAEAYAELLRQDVGEFESEIADGVRNGLDPKVTRESKRQTQSKLERLVDLLQRPGSIRIDILCRDLTRDEALRIEAVAIDAIGLEHLTNRIRGHHSWCQPLRAFQLSDEAKDIALTDAAVVVAISGHWAPGDYMEGLSVLDEQALWINARQEWSLADNVRQVIDERASTPDPVRLLGVHASTLPDMTATVLGGVVMGEWYLAGTKLFRKLSTGRLKWQFIPHQLVPPRRYLNNRLLTADGASRFVLNQGPVYSEALRTLL